VFAFGLYELRAAQLKARYLNLTPPQKNRKSSGPQLQAFGAGRLLQEMAYDHDIGSRS